MTTGTFSDLRRRLAIARRLPQPGKGILIRTEIEIYVYGWWRRIIGRPIRYPVINRRPGFFYRTTKAIPGVSFRVFGKPVVLLEPVVIEEEEVPLGSGDLGEDVARDGNEMSRAKGS